MHFLLFFHCFRQFTDDFGPFNRVGRLDHSDHIGCGCYTVLADFFAGLLIVVSLPEVVLEVLNDCMNFCQLATVTVWHGLVFALS